MNPPMQLLTAITGFEDQRAHQHPSAPKCLTIISQGKRFRKGFCQQKDRIVELHKKHAGIVQTLFWYRSVLYLGDGAAAHLWKEKQTVFPAGKAVCILKNTFYLKVRASPTFLVIPRLSQYSRMATANLREAPIRSRISARVIWPCCATCSFAI